MKIQDKIAFLQDNHFSEWLKTRQEVAQELSEKQSMFCVCRRLATGLHESGCRVFQNKITSETVKRLGNLLKQ